MYYLLLDSSNKYLSVGLANDKKKVVDRIFYEAWQRQSEVMVSEIGNILKRNNLTKDDLEGVVVGIGPGSYTGVRIAITIAKTIAYALKIKVYKVSSLSLLRNPSKPTICVFNARSGRSYFGCYDGDKVLHEDEVAPNEEVMKYIGEHKDYLVNGDTNNLDIESSDFDIIDNLALGINENNLVNNIFTLDPIYLKDLMK